MSIEFAGLRPRDATVVEAAERWAQRLSSAVLDDVERSDAFTLELNPSAEPPGYRFVLRCPAQLGGGTVEAEFVGGAMGYRLRAGGGRSQLLARAVGLKGAASLEILDATAGLGRDAFVMAALGCRVTLIERSPLVAALVSNGLARAAADKCVGDIVSRMRLVTGDARAFLDNLSSGDVRMRPDVIYMDPMYPERNKAALVKKELRVLRALVGTDDDAAELLAVATRAARRRVVVKRPLRAPALEGLVANTAIRGKTTRYDIYLNLG